MNIPAEPRKVARRRARRRQVLAPILLASIFLAGAAILLYPTASAWINQSLQSATIEKYTAEVGATDPSSLRAAIDAARKYNDALVGEAHVAANRNIPDAEPTGSNEKYMSLLDANGTGLMARIRIPSIHADLPVYHGTADDTLRNGVGHLEGTALPVGGTGTHAVLTGHRGLADAELFTHLDLVRVGDTFSIEVFGEVMQYRVRETKVVSPSDTHTLYPVAGADLVTLVTCTPLGINTQRILVTGERVEPTPAKVVNEAGSRPDIPGFAWWAVFLGCALVAATAYLFAASRPPRAAGRAWQNASRTVIEWPDGAASIRPRRRNRESIPTLSYGAPPREWLTR